MKQKIEISAREISIARRPLTKDEKYILENMQDWQSLFKCNGYVSGSLCGRESAEFVTIIERPATKDESKKIFEKFLTGEYGSFNERGKQFQSNPEVIIKEHENPDIDSYILRLKDG